MLLEEGADVNAVDNRGETALHWAAQQGLDSLVLLLLQNGADLSKKANESGPFSGETALHAASRRGHYAECAGHERVVELLLEHGAEVSAKNANGQTPLHEAASSGREAVVYALLNGGADDRLKSKHGDTPYDMATKYAARRSPWIAATIKAVAVHRARYVAFAMGQQERLGVGSRVMALDAGVVRIILDRM